MASIPTSQNNFHHREVNCNNSYILVSILERIVMGADIKNREEREMTIEKMLGGMQKTAAKNTWVAKQNKTKSKTSK